MLNIIIYVVSCFWYFMPPTNWQLSDITSSFVSWIGEDTTKLCRLLFFCISLPLDRWVYNSQYCGFKYMGPFLCDEEFFLTLNYLLNMPVHCFNCCRREAKKHRYWDHLWIAKSCFGTPIPSSSWFTDWLSKGKWPICHLFHISLLKL